MPIRKRVTDPYGQDYREFNRYMVEGRPPPAPRKPTSEERKPIEDALRGVPVGKLIPQREFNNKYILPYMRKTYTLWGQGLALYPTGVLQNTGKMRVTGVMVQMVVSHKRTGQKGRLMLNGDNPSLWYGKIIRWLQDTCYGG